MRSGVEYWREMSHQEIIPQANSKPSVIAEVFCTGKKSHSSVGKSYAE